MDALCLNLPYSWQEQFTHFLLTDSVKPLETNVLSKSAFRRMRVPSMAISRQNTTIQPMNDKLGTLVSADYPSGIYSLLISGIVATGALSSDTNYIPEKIGIVNDMMRRTSHRITPYVHRDSRLHSRPHRNRFSSLEQPPQPRLHSSLLTVCYEC